jgi:hypothetical protein
MVACTALSGISPAFAQAAPSGGWSPGSDAKGANTIVGRIESPGGGKTLTAGTNLLVTGWAADTTATGWAGIDGVEVWSGAKGSGGTKLASGTVGLSRPDVADALGGNFVNSGFSAVVNTSSLSGAMSLHVYLHTPDKGTYFKTVGVTINAAEAPAFATDPIVVILRPVLGETISQKQKNNKFSIFGYALDRNPITDQSNQTLGPNGTGISAISVAVDGSVVGSTSGGSGIGVNNITQPGPGAPTDLSKFPYVSRQYGPQFDLAGWSVAINPNNFAGDSWHTITATATSSITGCPTSCKKSTSSTTFFIKGQQKGKAITP